MNRRFCTHSKRGYGWFFKGRRRRIKSKIGYKNFYLYSAVDINKVDDFSLILPNVNSANMKLFLEKLSQAYPEDKLILIMDGVGWHKSKTVGEYENIHIIYLPPYSPELNPIEKLQPYIKSKILTNKIYKTIKDLEDNLCEFYKTLTQDDLLNICYTNYMFNQ